MTTTSIRDRAAVPRRRPTALFKRVGRTAIIVHPRGEMPEDEWLLNDTQLRSQLRAPGDRLIVWGEGTINAEQRRRARDWDQVRMLLFSESMLTRGIMRALSWMGVDAGAWEKARFDKVLQDEGFAPDAVAAIRAAIAEMEQQISGTSDAAG